MAEETQPGLPRDIHFGSAGVRDIAAGVTLLARLVGAAYGPHGGRVMLERAFDTPLHARDAERICRDFALDDPLAEIGVRLVRELQLRTRRAAGDGGATATLLFDAMLREGLRLLAGGIQPRALAAGLEAAAREADTLLQTQTRPVRGAAARRALAQGIAGDRALGDLLALAMVAAGRDGVVLVEPSRRKESEVARETGFRLQAGYASPLMAADTLRLQTRLDAPEIFVALDRVDGRDMVLPLLERAVARARPVLLVAPEVAGAALATLAANAARRGAAAAVVAVALPGHGTGREEQLQDLAAATGARPVTAARDLAEAGALDALAGVAGEALIGKGASVIRGGRADPLLRRLRLRAIDAACAGWPTEHEREQLQRRRGNLSGRTVLLRIGGDTDPEAGERLHRAEAALRGYGQALRDGVLPGAGVALLRAAAALPAAPGGDRTDPGRAVLRRALSRPAARLLVNAGVPQPARAAILDRWSASRGAIVLPGSSDGRRRIAPPMSATALRAGLRAAAAMAAMLLTASVVVTDRQDPG
ncbi:TCP-1/cpn60 chaperonin family protein [Marinibaculum pumilum]|uniref:60 kDa chaperonin n=1 Tax=Marinibaculum pumilum TaxID=1766165 RepID=A0ABV7L1K9_9PROT